MYIYIYNISHTYTYINISIIYIINIYIYIYKYVNIYQKSYYMYYMYRSQKISVTNCNLCAGPIPDTGGMGMFFEKKFWKKGNFVCLYPHHRFQC